MTGGGMLHALRDLHERPGLVARAATPAGRVALWLVATVLMPARVAPAVSPLLALYLLLPTRRREILTVGSLWVLFRLVSGGSPAADPVSTLVGAGIVVGLIVLAHRAARHFAALPAPVRRHPLLASHVVLWLGLALCWTVPAMAGPDTPASVTTLARTFAVVLPFLVWRLGYLLLAGQRGTARETTLLDHAWWCLPVYGGSNVPYGKGYDYLTENAAHEAEAIARTQLAGVKLLVLAWLWRLANSVIAALVHGEGGGPLGLLAGAGSVGLPRLADLVAGADAGLAACWAALFVELVTHTLAIAVYGHAVIGCLRLFGFAVFRNTYKPLLSESILDFWNRFYYYFKELLVDFFFYPTYIRYFRTRPALRMFAAVMAAACVGNVYYHVVRDSSLLVESGVRGSTALLAPRAFYSFLLGLGVFLSMQRRQNLQRRRAAGATPERWPAAARARRIAGVWLFYSLIHIWNVSPASLTMRQRTGFFLGLFGLG